MKRRPKLIILNGFAGSGKTTIAKRYIKKHPLSINIEGDEIIAMIGGWKANYKKARECVFPHTKSMIRTHLEFGYDVIVPYLLTNDKEADEFEKIANKHQADFYEIYLYTSKENAINRLLDRGRWGEEGLPPLTKKQLPKMKLLYEKMVKATVKRPNTKIILVRIGDIEHTYGELLRLIS